MRASSFLQFFALCSVFCYAKADDPTVSVNVGSIATIIGYTHADPEGFIFYGIPYAQAPIGQNRFAPTQRKDPAGRVLAFHFGSSCRQAANNGNYEEDCLYLNIWTPKMSNFTNNRYPVLFWIHGGGFVIGSGNLDTTGILKNLVSRGIIVVSINYRLGAFGFFTTRDSTVPGNMGMKDQIEALNWVKRYISYFGGDPNAITIDGESAGGESVSLLTLSPLTKGLFNRAIVESGSAFSPGVISYSDSQTDASKQAAIRLNCITAADWESRNPTSMNAMLQCMRRKTVAEIEASLGGWDGWEHWGPIRDDSVFPDRLENLAMKRGPIPVIIGNCKDEWLNTFKDQLQHDPTFPTKFTRQSQIEEIHEHFEFNFYNNSAMVRQQAQGFYIDNRPYADQDHVSWVVDNIQLYSDMIFTGPTYREAMNFRQTGSPVYLYSFDYLAPAAMPLLNASYRGVPHTWELQYLMGYPATSAGGWPITNDDIATMNSFGLYWTNFVKYGNPTPPPSAVIWPQLGNHGEFMKLGPSPTPSVAYHPMAATFWACIVPAIEGYKPVWCP